jgi:ferric-dicitrate binding protein FerR (iron transport regulator)
VAAIALLALALGSAGFYVGWRQQKTAVFTEVISGENQVLHDVTLPDGSVVSLNSTSKIHFPRQFSGKQRKVSIEGEAFFNVKPDPENPFVISAGTALIRVLGTSFNVCARPGENTVEVTVETGKVQFGCNRLAQKPCDQLILTPGEKGVLFSADQTLKKSVNDNPNVNAWITHDLIFNKTTLREVTDVLQGVYHIDIQLSDPALGDLVLTAHFNDQPIDFILEVIRLTFSLELSAQNGQYFLTAANKNLK